MRRTNYEEQQDCLALMIGGLVERLEVIEDELGIKQTSGLNCPKCDSLLSELIVDEPDEDDDFYSESYYCPSCNESIEFKGVK